MPDYRRESQEIIKKLNLSALDIVECFEVSLGTAYNWMNGKSSPSRKFFDKLKLMTKQSDTPDRLEFSPLNLNVTSSQYVTTSEVLKLEGRIVGIEQRLDRLQSKCDKVETIADEVNKMSVMMQHLVEVVSEEPSVKKKLLESHSSLSSL